MKNISDQDKKIWEEATKDVIPLGESSTTNPPKIYDFINFDKILDPFLPTKKTKASSSKYQAIIDLHGMTQDEAYNHLISSFSTYKNKKYSCILIITGKGGFYGRKKAGILKRKVPLWIGTARFKKYVRSWSQANRNDGGEGAIYVYLN